MLSILADENVPSAVVEALQRADHEVRWARVDFPGESDSFLCELAQRESRLLFTFDKDFGELAFRSSLDSDAGGALLRTGILAPAKLAAIVAAALKQQILWAGHCQMGNVG
ncbi:MAG: DUF5615 family PIN-like protein [Phycisphaerae bacterium]|nr:DUF5615 family PIN-like protein [Phycisphaerae bacterium]